MRTLGIDFGERRIGLALSDEEGRFALPSRVVERTSDAAAIAEIATLAAAEGVAALVVGEPRRPADGAATAAGRRARSFGEKLAAATGLPVEWIDESLTSREAEARLRDAGARPRTRRERRDALAAQILLQEALDRRARRRAGR
jgi:putative Holliday junction resolvase